MEDSRPVKSVCSKLPISVEESRAQRLQRSQSRFRDRGGIFVPTVRNTLADILLGRKVASPKKKRERSASLSPKKKGIKSDAPKNNDEARAVRTSPRKAIQRREPEAGPSHVPNVVSKHKIAKKSTKEATTPANITSEAKVKEDDENLSVKKRGRKSKATVQEIPSSADVSANHDPLPLEKFQPRTKKSRTQGVSKKAVKLKISNGDIPADTARDPELKRSTRAASKSPSDEVPVDDGDIVKKSSRASTSKKYTTSKWKPVLSVDHEPEPAPLQQSSTCRDLSKSKRNSVAEDDRPTDAVDSKKRVAVKGKGKGKALQSTDRGDKPDVAAVVIPPKPRKKRARPVESEMECPSPSKRVKRLPAKEAKSNQDRRKAPRTRKSLLENGNNVSTQSKNILSKSPPSKKRARESGEERTTATKRKKTKGVAHANPISDGTVDTKQIKAKEANKNKKAKKTKKPPALVTSRTKKSTAKAPNQDKSHIETKTEPGAVYITRIRPRKSVIVRMKDPEPHQIENNDPDPINFLC